MGGQILLGGTDRVFRAGLSCAGRSDCGLAEALCRSSRVSLDPWREPVRDGVSGQLANSLHRHAALAKGLLALQLAVGAALGAWGLPLVLALAHNLLAATLLTVLLGLL